MLVHVHAPFIDSRLLKKKRGTGHSIVSHIGGGPFCFVFLVAKNVVKIHFNYHIRISGKK